MNKQPASLGIPVKEIYAKLSNINDRYDPEEMVHQHTYRNLLKVSESMSAPLLYLSSSTVATFSAIVNGKIKVHQNHKEDIILWTLICGQKGSGKSPAFEFVSKAVGVVEDYLREKNKRNEEEREEDEGNKKPKMDPAKLEKDSIMKAQLWFGNCTYQGIEEFFHQKLLLGSNTKVLLAQDEFSTLLNNLDKDKGYVPFLLQAYTGKRIRVNMRERSYDIPKPLLHILAYSQAETVLKFMKGFGEDTGGLFERMSFVAPTIVYKNLEKERTTDLSDVPDLSLVLLIALKFFDNEREFTLSEEGQEALDEFVRENNENLKEHHHFDSFRSGLYLKSYTQVVRFVYIS